MLMSRSKYILFAVFALLAAGAFAQKAERDYIRKGNRFFNDSVFVDAEVNYRKALEANPKSTVSMYNLGNTLSQQRISQIEMCLRETTVGFNGFTVIHLGFCVHTVAIQPVSTPQIVTVCFLLRP